MVDKLSNAHAKVLDCKFCYLMLETGCNITFLNIIGNILLIRLSKRIINELEHDKTNKKKS